MQLQAHLRKLAEVAVVVADVEVRHGVGSAEFAGRNVVSLHPALPGALCALTEVWLSVLCTVRCETGVKRCKAKDDSVTSAAWCSESKPPRYSCLEFSQMWLSHRRVRQWCVTPR